MTEAPLTLADFAPAVGKTVRVETHSGPFELVLAQAQELPRSAREGGSFRLEFQGPLQPVLGQGIYRFVVDGRPSDIFIVPVARTAEAMRYEAIFY